MLNEDKIKLMTSIAMFEKREGKAIAPAGRYFRSDYVSGRMLRSFFFYTFSYLLCVFVTVLYKLDELLSATDFTPVIQLARGSGFLYIAGLVFYLAVTFFVYSRRYEYAGRGMKVYVAKLRRLEKRYEFQSRTRELTKEGSRYDDVSRA